MASSVAIKLNQVLGLQLSFCHECIMKPPQCMFYFSFYVFIYSLHHFNAKCSNLNTQACLMGQRWGRDRPAAGLHMLLDKRHLRSLSWSERCTCFTLLHIWQTSSTPKPTNSRSHRITFTMKIIPHILLEDKCSPENMTPWAPFNRQTQPWHESDKIDCMNNYPDMSPKWHQTFWDESVRA